MRINIKELSKVSLKFSGFYVNVIARAMFGCSLLVTAESSVWYCVEHEDELI